VSGSFHYILSERERDTVTIWLNHPERLNVLSLALMEELTQAFVDVGESDATGVILAAKGRLFSAGHDFAEMANQDFASVRHLFGACTTMMQTIQSIPQPVVARVHALATGGGCQLVATADLAVAAEEATFCTPGGKGGLFCTTPMVAAPWIIFCIGLLVLCVLLFRSRRSSRRRPPASDEPGNDQPLQQRKLDGSTRN